MKMRQKGKTLPRVVTVHGALHLAARHPAGKMAVACIQPLAVRRLFNGLDAVTGAPKGCEQ